VRHRVDLALGAGRANTTNMGGTLIHFLLGERLKSQGQDLSRTVSLELSWKMAATPQSISFPDYNLTIVNNILTAKPKSKQGPAVTVNLNEVVGVKDDKLAFGKRDFSKKCKDIEIRVVKGQNWLHATIKKGSDGLPKQGQLLLDGHLQITIPSDKIKENSGASSQDDCECKMPCVIA